MTVARMSHLARTQTALRSVVQRTSNPLRALPLQAARRMSRGTFAINALAVGDKLPADATFSYFDAEGTMQTISVGELTAGKKVILFAVPGAFTPTCSLKHLPGFIEKADELKSKGVDTIGCVATNDAFVMSACMGGGPCVEENDKGECCTNMCMQQGFGYTYYINTATGGKSLGADDKVLMLADGSGLFAKAIGVELDLTDKGLGMRSRRYAMLVDDGAVKVLNLEEGGAFTVSSADDMLAAL